MHVRKLLETPEEFIQLSCLLLSRSISTILFNYIIDGFALFLATYTCVPLAQGEITGLLVQY